MIHLKELNLKSKFFLEVQFRESVIIHQLQFMVDMLCQRIFSFLIRIRVVSPRIRLAIESTMIFMTMSNCQPNSWRRKNFNISPLPAKKKLKTHKLYNEIVEFMKEKLSKKLIAPTKSFKAEAKC